MISVLSEQWMAIRLIFSRAHLTMYSMCAALRSIGSFHVTHDHIAFNYPPDSIHRDIIFHRVELNKPGVYTDFEIRLLSREGSISSPHLMAVELSVWRSPSLSSSLLSSVSSHPDGLDTRKSSSSSSSSPSLASPLPKEASSDYLIQQDIDFFVKLETDALNTSVYVCPAACHSPPIPVTSTKQVVPFTISVPPTALMYLGTDLKDLTMYSQTIHFEEIHNGPAPRHDIITMHRHGHAFGGLPWLFWISLVLLIAVFHMFFCKIIYNELRGRNQASENQNPWRLPHYATDLRSPSAYSARVFINEQLSRRRRTDMDTVP
ncbi:unnamed protein product [Trichobilharzia szidati]|nr:unnamed protein product [Trichobilharzia szidati]